MYTLINASPKTNNSNSLFFLNKISGNLKNYCLFELKKDKYEDILMSIKNSSVVVFAFPLYVDSPPSIMLKFLDYIIDNNKEMKDKLVYFIVNCGFREANHNVTAVNIVKMWIKKVGSTYGASLLIGAGEIVGNKKYRCVSISALKKLYEFSDIIKMKRTGDDIFTTVNFLNNKMYCFIANIFWKKSCRANSLTNKNILEK